jgi:hypothetical protein
LIQLLTVNSELGGFAVPPLCNFIFVSSVNIWFLLPGALPHGFRSKKTVSWVVLLDFSLCVGMVARARRSYGMQ